jgi:tetratricopeptide (TPR) repeat protein
MAHPLKKIILLLAALAIPVGPITARADSAADARAEAKKHYDRAMELNEDGQVAEAVIELKRAYEIAPHHTVLYNLGQAYITLAKPVEAVAALQRYLDEGGKDIKPARRAEVEQEIARQKTRIATLDISGLPDGAVVTIDGDDVGRAPLVAPLRVGVGKHVVAATAAGYEPGEAKIEIAGEDRKVRPRFRSRPRRPTCFPPPPGGRNLRRGRASCHRRERSPPRPSPQDGAACGPPA